ncbi:hypothetical protein Leryth_026910 [Lithospermum erythrorhizon]|nr:hypothetical protein Leryth_026910 [Lithospermum erythrorhizon]
MAKRTKKVGIVGKYGTRYGDSLRSRSRDGNIPAVLKRKAVESGDARIAARSGRWYLHNEHH